MHNCTTHNIILIITHKSFNFHITTPKSTDQLIQVPSGGSTDTACVGPVKSALALSASSEAEEDSQSYEIWTAGSLARFFKNSMTYLSNAHLPEEDDDDDTLLQGMFPKSDWAKYCAETVYPKTYEQA